MACVVCGEADHEASWIGTWAHCPKAARGSKTGWTCSACHKGNAPGVKGCVHCAAPVAPVDGTTNAAGLAAGKYVVVSNEPDPRYRKIQIRRA